LDNLFKIPIDALRKAGLIEGDDIKTVKAVTARLPKEGEKDNPGTVWVSVIPAENSSFLNFVTVGKRGSSRAKKRGKQRGSKASGMHEFAPSDVVNPPWAKIYQPQMGGNIQ